MSLHTPPQDPEKIAYRKCVGVMILNAEGKVLVGRRINKGNLIGINTWQMPQGGIDSGETPYQAALREMKEEITTVNIRLIAESQQWIAYDFPLELRTTLWGGRFYGQPKMVFMEFLGEDSEINIQTQNPEFIAWRWVDVNQLCDLIVSFKHDMYVKVLEEFKDYLNFNGNNIFNQQ